MKKVLFLTEFSPHAPEVLKFAADIAYFFKARLVLMNAFNQSELTLLMSEEIEKLKELSLNRLVELGEANLSEAYKNIKTEYLIKTGFASEAVQKVAAEHDIDLVVMGMTGKNNMIDNIFGTTALEVLAKVQCPVLLVPHDAKFHGIDNFVYTTNFEFRDLAAINYLKQWSKVFEATVHCLHIVEPGDNMLGAFQNKDILQETYKSDKRVSVDLAEGDFREEVEKFARRKKADIVVMMMRKDNFITRWIKSSSVKGVAKNINIPLLVIKDDVYKQTGDLVKFLELMNSIA